MRILLAVRDEALSSSLCMSLTQWGYEPLVASNRDTMWRELAGAAPVRLLLIGCCLGEVSGTDLVRRLRAEPDTAGCFIILVHDCGTQSGAAAALEAGADDFVPARADPAELRARVAVGRRVLELQQALSLRIVQLQEALSRVRLLEGVLPICSYCRRVRDDANYWQQLEGFITTHTEARFSHSICPDCWTRHVQPEIEELMEGSDLA